MDPTSGDAPVNIYITYKTIMKDKKMTFVWIAVGLIVLSFALVFTNNITWEQALAGGGTLVSLVFGLYQWYSKTDLKRQNNVLLDKTVRLQRRLDIMPSKSPVAEHPIMPDEAYLDQGDTKAN